MKKLLVLGAVALLAGIGTTIPADAARAEPYVVLVRDGVDAATVAKGAGVTPTLVFPAIGGFAANLTGNQVNGLTRNAKVESVAPDDVVAAVEPPAPPPSPFPQGITSGIRRIGGLESPTADIDGVDERIDVDVAVLDTGIQPDHPDLNVAGGVSCVKGTGWDDSNGHGTLVAGFVGAIDDPFGAVGVAPGTRVWAVRVANDKGMIKESSLLCGLDWVQQHADVVEIANMSFGMKASQPVQSCEQNSQQDKQKDHIRQPICDLVEGGVTVVASAGNEAVDSASQVPAAYPEVITVSALGDSDGQPGGLGANPVCLPDQIDDHFAFFSNFGAPVDIAAPGVCISSTFIGSQYANASGTSFSAPLVSGAAALYISAHSDASPAQVQQTLVARSEAGPMPGDPDTFPEGVLNVRGL